MLPPKFVSSCFHLSQDLHHCQSTPSFLARPKPKISLCSRNQTETRAMQASRFPRWSLTSTSTVNIYISPLFACVTNLEDLKEHTFKNYQEHPIGVPVIIEWGGAIDLKNYADRKECVEKRLRYWWQYTIVSMVHCLHLSNFFSASWLRRIRWGIKPIRK